MDKENYMPLTIYCSSQPKPAYSQQRTKLIGQAQDCTNQKNEENGQDQKTL